ncbi:MAG TPA: reverse transcriptase/maturase family protein [Pirellulales bacterium]|nr:reverse transcriptase/maturase family protein [Pirellulales bacterium]
MAQTYANLWPGLVGWENLLAAYQKCRRRKRYKPEAVAFDAAWETNLLELSRDLRRGDYQPGEYRHFEVFEPKRRTISAAPFRDRVVHHALVRVLEPIFERRFIFDSYACRKGKGTHAALHRAQHYLRRWPFYLKTDIVKFYPNVDHDILLRVLVRLIRDERVVALIQQIVASGAAVGVENAQPQYFAGDDLFVALRPRGLPIGNLTSQFFANVLLDDADHYVKELLRAPGYVRYADDMVLFAASKTQLWEHRDALASRLAEMRLKLHTGKTQVRPSQAGLKFLGFVLGRSGRRLQQSAAQRFNRRIRRLRWLKAQRKTSPAEIGRSTRAWLAHARGANSTGMRRELWRRLKF